MKIKYTPDPLHAYPQSTVPALLEACGLIPLFATNPVYACKDLRTALDKQYQHGGGLQPFNGTITDGIYSYPGDPSRAPYLVIERLDEKLYIYPNGIIAIVQPDKSYFISRMD